MNDTLRARYRYLLHTGDMPRASSVILVLLWIGRAGTGYGQITPRSADELAIQELAQRYMQARNSRNAEATRSLFTPDADQLVSTGEWRRGLEALVRGAMSSSQKEAGNSSIHLETIRFLGSDVALADGRYETVTSSTGASRSMWTTLIMRRTNQGWRIAAIRNMLPAPTASSTQHER